MSGIKKKTRRKLTKRLGKLVKKHGAETTLALVTGIVGAFAAESDAPPDRPERPRLKPPAGTEATRALGKPIIVRKRGLRPSAEE